MGKCVGVRKAGKDGTARGPRASAKFRNRNICRWPPAVGWATCDACVGSMLISLDKSFVFIAAGKTGTSSVSLSLLPHLTTDFARMPYSMVLDMPSHPEIESLLGAGAENVSGADTIKGLGLLHAAAADAATVASSPPASS